MRKKGNSMRLAIFQLYDDNMLVSPVYPVSRYHKLRKEIEGYSPARYDNPVLVVLPPNIKSGRSGAYLTEFGNRRKEYSHTYHGFPGGIGKWVVAVPQSGWGAGEEYAHLVNRNRKRFGLPGQFKPSEEMTAVMEFRREEGPWGKSFGGRIMNVIEDLGAGLYPCEPEDPECLKESSKNILAAKRERLSAAMSADEIARGIE